AIVGAAVLGARLQAMGPVAGLEPVLLGLPVREVVGDQGLLDTMLAAALEVEDVLALGDDLGRDQLKAGLAQARGLAEEQVRRNLALRARLVRRRGSRPIHRPPVP